MGDYIFVGENTEILAHKIGSFVEIGKGSKICERAVINDSVLIEEGSVVEADAVIPSFTVYGGKPATFKGLLVESFPIIMKQKNDTYFNKFIGVNPKDKEGTSSRDSAQLSARDSKIDSARGSKIEGASSPSKSGKTVHSSRAKVEDSKNEE